MGILVIGTVTVASCGSPGPVGRRLVITQTTSTPTAAVVGDTVVVELVSSAYGRDGGLVAWGRPRSDTPTVLAPVGAAPGPCPRRATCSAFTARAVGTATVTAVGPSGILCPGPGPRGDPCVGVTPVLRRFVVRVSATS